MQSENRKKEIHLYMNSPGGDVIATLAETRVSLLAIDPTTSEAAQELTDIVTKLRALVQQPAS